MKLNHSLKTWYLSVVSILGSRVREGSKALCRMVLDLHGCVVPYL